jgi:hypothetical protein
MNRFIGSLAIVTTLSYHYFEIAITITHNQFDTLQIQDCLERSFTTERLITHTMNTTDSHTLLTLTEFKVKVKVKVTLRLAVYRQSVHLGVKLLETQRPNFFSTELLR